jgi:hypothetical protein
MTLQYYDVKCNECNFSWDCFSRIHDGDSARCGDMPGKLEGIVRGQGLGRFARGGVDRVLWGCEGNGDWDE